MGSNFAALIAGNKPAMIATIMVIAVADNIAIHGVVKLKLATDEISKPIEMPRSIPNIPPN